MLSFVTHPVKDAQGVVLHEECLSKLRVLNRDHHASTIMPWIHRLGYQGRFDAIVVETAIVELHNNPKPISIHLCTESISNIQFRHTINTIFSQTPSDLLSLLSIDIPERAAFEHLIDFKTFCESIKRYPCKIGLKHFGQALHNLALIHEIGLDYLKLDYSLMVQLNERQENLSFVQGLCSVAHSVGMRVYVPGNLNEKEVNELSLLGIDGFSHLSTDTSRLMSD